MILVLDLDGVVQTGHAEGGRWDKNLARDLGVDAQSLQERFFKRRWQDLLTGKADLYLCLGEVWPTLACDASPEQFVRYWFEHDCTLDPQLLERTDALRRDGKQVFLATNQEHRRAAYLWEGRSLSHHFDRMIYSAELGAQKPDRLFFERATKRLPVQSAGDVLFLDDSYAHVDAARAFGWHARLYRGIADLDRALEDFRLRG